MPIDATNPMHALYAKLNTLGLPRAYVRRVLLPDWWDDDAAANPTGFTEATWVLARHLGISPKALAVADEPLALPSAPNVVFKNAKSTTEQEVALARALAVQTARFAALGAPKATTDLPHTAEEIREAILETGSPWVGFEGLLKYCWTIGIPVIHVANLPRTAKKMHALAANVDGRFVIVISIQRTQPAWLLFILAHELGHIVLRHVANESALIDAEVQQDSVDPQEVAANRFAMSVITGQETLRVTPTGRWPNAEALARDAMTLGTQLGVDPGHIILNYAKSMSVGDKNFWAVASAALSKLPSEPNPLQAIHSHIAGRLDWQRLPKETAEFVMRMARPVQDNAA